MNAKEATTSICEITRELINSQVKAVNLTQVVYGKTYEIRLSVTERTHFHRVEDTNE